MKRLSLVCFLILLCLIIIGSLRWKIIEPWSTEKGVKTLLRRDQWTGQHWITRYGVSTYGSTTPRYLGETEPISSEIAIQSKMTIIKEMPESKAREKKRQQIIQEIETRRDKYQKDYNKFLEMSRKLEEKNSMAIMAFLIIVSCNDLTYDKWQSYEEGKKLINDIPKNIIESYIAWFTINSEKYQYSYKRYMDNWLHLKARKQLEKSAYLIRNAFTIVWWISMVLFFMIGVVFLVYTPKTKTQLFIQEN